MQLRLWALALPIVMLACPSEAPEKQADLNPPAAGRFPGHEPPALEQLLDAARTRVAPTGSDVPYRPESVSVPPLTPPDLTVLPKSESGKPLLVSVQATGLVVDMQLADPITAKGDCLTLVSNCIAPAGSLDSCFASVPACDDDQPWAGTESCCHPRCQALYAGLRGRDYSQLQAFELTAQSLCFPGLGEFLEASQ